METTISKETVKKLSTEQLDMAYKSMIGEYYKIISVIQNSIKEHMPSFLDGWKFYLSSHKDFYFANMSNLLSIRLRCEQKEDGKIFIKVLPMTDFYKETYLDNKDDVEYYITLGKFFSETEFISYLNGMLGSIWIECENLQIQYQLLLDELLKRQEIHNKD